MALPDLVARLERDAQQRITDLRANTQAQVSALAAQAAAVRDAQRDSELRRRRAVRRARLELELAQARQRARADQLHAQHALLVKIFQRAGEQLAAVATSPEYVNALPSHVKEALQFVEGQDVTVRCPPALVRDVRRAVEGRPGVTVVEDAQAPPGILVSTTDGTVVVDNTLPARLKRLVPRLAVELLAQVPP
jgi:vacuolar-type H+-ATPase subunit E/Vma4